MFAYRLGSLFDSLNQIPGIKEAGMADISFSVAAGKRLKHINKRFMVVGLGRTAGDLVPDGNFIIVNS